MRILIISDVSSYMRGGVPVETKELLKGLVLRGHEVAFWADAPLCGDEVRQPIVDRGREQVGASGRTRVGAADRA